MTACVGNTRPVRQPKRAEVSLSNARGGVGVVSPRMCRTPLAVDDPAGRR